MKQEHKAWKLREPEAFRTKDEWLTGAVSEPRGPWQAARNIQSRHPLRYKQNGDTGGAEDLSVCFKELFGLSGDCLGASLDKIRRF